MSAMSDNNRAYRRGLEVPPARMRSLPIDERGYPVPYFVEWIDGKPDFRVISSLAWQQCVRERKCWLCGITLGRHKAFVIGPMCAVNRTTSEPPSHLECALYAVRTCPFMVLPRAKRNDRELPEGYKDAAGVHLDRNPGVMCVWVTSSYKIFHVEQREGAVGGVLIEIGESTARSWWREGRRATRAETLASIGSGMPALRKLAVEQSDEAVVELNRRYNVALDLLPIT